MPQLEQVATYLSQVFWLVVTFGILYVVMWKAALPRVAGVLRERQERIDDDLEKAEELKREAEKVLSAYEATMADARSQAQSILRETSETLSREAAERHAALSGNLSRDAAAAEARIAKASEEALGNIRTVAAEVAQAAAAHLVGGEVSAADAEKAVADAGKDQT